MDNIQEIIESLFIRKPNENIQGLLTGKKVLVQIKKQTKSKTEKILEKYGFAMLVSKLTVLQGMRK